MPEGSIMGRAFASRVSHHRIKWVILVFWLVLAAAAAPLAGGLTAEQDNEISSWLPGDAESTLALEQLIELGSDPNIVLAVLVYERTDGLTDADFAAIQDDAQAFGQLDALDGAEGWEAIAPLVDGMRAEASDGPDGLDVYVTGPAGFAADSSEAFAGIDSTLLYAALGVVIAILLLTYRSPVLWILPILSAVV